MNITGISASDPISGSGSASGSNELGQDAFMTLLVEQLKNQDPLQPTANEEFVAELANFSSLEQMEELNENLLGLIVLQQSNALLSQLTEGSALIGKEVRFYDAASDAYQTGSVDSVKIEDGYAQINIGGKDVALADVIEVLGDAPEADSTTDPDSDDSTADTTDA